MQIGQIVWTLRIHRPTQFVVAPVRRFGFTPFLKEFVKPKRFPSGLLRTGSAVRNRLS